MTTILCIDDETEIRNLLVEEFQEAGFKTLEAANGKEGLEIILSRWPDLVVSDVSMPVMDGHQLLAEIQINHPEFANIPFIMLTALTDRENTIMGLEAGAEAYLTKPVDLDMLLAKVTGCMTRAESNRRVGGSF
jgi:DNA-binding response OmpR family regulator